MADPISLSSGMLTLVVFAFQSGKTLYQTFDSIQNNARTVRELKDELKALNDVLESLEETIKQSETKLSALKQPLLSCGKACEEFAVVVAKCTAHSDGSRISLRDWARLSYMGKDITQFRNLIAGYKSTIMIALGDANIRTAIVTADLLNEYKEMIKNTTADLEELLQGVNTQINSEIPPVPDNSATIGHSEEEEQSIKEQRASIEQCLRICDDLSSLIEVKARELASTPTLKGEQPASVVLGGITTARVNTSKSLEDCKRGLGITSSELKTMLNDLNNRVVILSQQSETPGGRALNNQSLEAELASIKKCLEICTQATEQVTAERVNVFEDVEMADDGHQIIVATLGDLISAKRITVGARSKQWLGQMSDASLQQLSKDRGEDTARAARGSESGAHFEGRHGAGRQLSDLTYAGDSSRPPP